MEWPGAFQATFIFAAIYLPQASDKFLIYCISGNLCGSNISQHSHFQSNDIKFGIMTREQNVCVIKLCGVLLLKKFAIFTC